MADNDQQEDKPQQQQAEQEQERPKEQEGEREQEGEAAHVVVRTEDDLEVDMSTAATVPVVTSDGVADVSRSDPFVANPALATGYEQEEFVEIKLGQTTELSQTGSDGKFSIRHESNNNNNNNNTAPARSYNNHDNEDSNNNNSSSRKSLPKSTPIVKVSAQAVTHDPPQGPGGYANYNYDVLGDKYTISTLKEDDVEKVSKMMARATFEDPLLVYLTEGSDSKDRLETGRWLISKVMSMFVKANPETSWCIRDRYTDDIVACCIAVANQTTSFYSQIGSLAMLPFKLGVGKSLRFLTVWDVLDKTRETALEDKNATSGNDQNNPSSTDAPACIKHAYLAFVGVEPEMQHRGLGKLIIHYATEELERKGYTSYVDLHTDRACRVFEQIGFRPCAYGTHKEELVVGPQFTALRRDPAGDV